jgi:hypothetical protein
MRRLWLKGGSQWFGLVCLVLGQIAFLVLFLRTGLSLVAGGAYSIPGALIVLCFGVIALAVASRALGSKTLWWQATMWALALAAAILAINLYIQAFPTRLDLIVPATISFAVFLAIGATYAWLQKRYVP